MLGQTYIAEGKYALAHPLLVETLEIQRRTMGAEHPLTLDIMSNLAHLYYVEGNVAEAERLFKEVLEGQRRALGPDHPFTLTSLNSLAVLYQQQYRFGRLNRCWFRCWRQAGAFAAQSIPTR